MKIKLVKIDDEKRSKGRGFIKRVKERWDLEFLEQASISMHIVRNNASRFQKEPERRNLILVRNRKEIDQHKDRAYEDSSNHQIAFEHEALNMKLRGIVYRMIGYKKQMTRLMTLARSKSSEQ